VTHIRPLLRSDMETVGQCLSSAFSEDPVFTWLSGGVDPSDVAARAAGFFRAAARAGLTRGHSRVIEHEGSLVGAAIWCPPDVGMFEGAEVELLLNAVLEHFAEGAMERLGALGAAVGERHPHEPHFYLNALGVVPRQRGRGLGAPLLGAVLEAADRDGLGAYLESSNPRNVSFYERLGFESTWTERIGGGPVMTGMWRAAR
jgi:GNAT superfamily N-acetyltransferase